MTVLSVTIHARDGRLEAVTVGRWMDLGDLRADVKFALVHSDPDHKLNGIWTQSLKPGHWERWKANEP